MYYSLTGLITLISKDFIIIQVNNIEYQLYVSKPSVFEINKITKVYIYHHIREDEEYLVGLSTLEEKEVFLALIQVKGIGPKTALSMLGASKPDLLLSAISSNNIAYLKRLPGIGERQASQILLDLKGTYVPIYANINQYNEVKLALRNMGFKARIIDDVLAEINLKNASNEDVLKEALRRLKR